MLLRQRMEALAARRDVGGGVLAGGLALCGTGAGLMVGMSLASKNDPNNANIEAFYAGGVGALASGAVLTLVGLPMTAANAAAMAKLESGDAAQARAVRATVLPGAIALSW